MQKNAQTKTMWANIANMLKNKKSFINVITIKFHIKTKRFKYYALHLVMEELKMDLKKFVRRIKELFRQNDFVWIYDKKRGWVQDFTL